MVIFLARELHKHELGSKPNLDHQMFFMLVVACMGAADGKTPREFSLIDRVYEDLTVL